MPPRAKEILKLFPSLCLFFRFVSVRDSLGMYRYMHKAKEELTTKNGSLCMARESRVSERTRGTGRIKKQKQNKYSVIAPVVTKGI